MATKTTRPKTTKTKAARSATAAKAGHPKPAKAKGALSGARKKVVGRAVTGTAPASARTAATLGIPKLPKAVAGAVRAAQGRQARDIVILDLRKAEGFTDYFVICTGTNTRQIKAIADAVSDALRVDFEERPVLAEGVQKSEWILLDYFNFVVHIFSSDCRAFYGLERLWGSAERYECADTD
ncbi:MAG: ribosome silencing factor [Acidobacteria bacterium]|nr:ribosome silencing factor [Acidobacteriota bacterium]